MFTVKELKEEIEITETTVERPVKDCRNKTIEYDRRRKLQRVLSINL